MDSNGQACARWNSRVFAILFFLEEVLELVDGERGVVWWELFSYRVVCAFRVKNTISWGPRHFAMFERTVDLPVSTSTRSVCPNITALNVLQDGLLTSRSN